VWPYNQRDLRVPVSQWKLVQRFDTASACEVYLQEMKDDPGAEGLKKLGEMGIGLFGLKVARCIFSDVRTSRNEPGALKSERPKPRESFVPS